LVAIDVTDCEITRAGPVVTIRRSKTDQEGQGQKVATISVNSHEKRQPAALHN
jgi:hypothetical protein